MMRALMQTAALFLVARRCSHPVCPSTWKQTSKPEREARMALGQKGLLTRATRTDYACAVLRETHTTARLVQHGLNKLCEVESQTQEIERWLPRSGQGREGGKEVSVRIGFQFCKMKEFQRSLYSCQHNTAQLCF